LPVATSPTSIDGHQAMRSSDSGSEVLKVHDVNGFDVSIAALGPDAVQKIDSLGGLVGYFHAMTVYQTDPNTWTTDVVG
ncbi:MAG: hypothetical protein ACRDVE_09535, partial [Actinocrinis sp.]